eukprot:3000753-Rhodomonas_salina.1
MSGLVGEEKKERQSKAERLAALKHSRLKVPPATSTRLSLHVRLQEHVTVCARVQGMCARVCTQTEASFLFVSWFLAPHSHTPCTQTLGARCWGMRCVSHGTALCM